MLTPEQQAEILAMHFGQKKGSRAIAEALGIGRKAVRKVIERRRVALEVEQTARGSIIDPYKPIIAELLEKDPRMPANTVLQRLRDEGYLGGYTVVKNCVRYTRATPARSREAFLKLMFVPGECAQVDWGEFGDVFGDGSKVHCFLMVFMLFPAALHRVHAEREVRGVHPLPRERVSILRWVGAARMLVRQSDESP